MKKFLLLILCFMLGILTACSGGESTSTEQAGEGKEETEELKNVSIMLDWYPNAVHSYLYVAQEKGYFKEEGLNVDIQFPANPTDPINLAAAGQITLGISYQPDVIIARANQDVKIKSVGAIVRSPLNRVVFLEDSEIQSPKDLEGKTVGYPGIPLNESLIKSMVKADGGNPDNVEMVDVGFELGSSIVSEKVDAVIGAYINHEVPVLKHEGYETRNLNPTEYSIPSYNELIAVTSDKTWEEEQDSIKAFWRAATKGYEFTAENPEEALNILLSNQDEANFPLVEEVEVQSLDILLPLMESDEGFGSQSKEQWEDTINWMKEAGLIEKDPAVEDIFVNISE
ncbi:MULTISPECIES: ABC transporter substrate-binding protein [Metabacillus]|uniref:ABC transporter substrate-binding protein n=3 Tax=Metabacillus TaxID=2675233 RepID=A0A179T2Q9_9BACI|nr:MULTISPECIES: ABC transporter substrate-binding protein [Metabacillus]OAS86772.1 ABC transporter substrate-binding protein [Metabacillus litoralis]QNF29157.1 ABC transporter substrate-binding protein [Metabacillus sp. KUDC1714]